MSNYLLEIGVEEFPAKYIKSTQQQLNIGIVKLLEENNYVYGDIVINSTPRRFAIIINDINVNNDNSVETIKGPAKKIAFDEEGQPTRALQGFMKSKDITLEDITYKVVNGEDYIYANIKTQTRPIDEILVEGIPNVIKSVSNPRQMRWGGKNLKFLRPIRWIVSLLDDKVLKFDLEGIKVSNVTKGHRTLGNSEIVINTIDEYEEKLKENFVIVSEYERRKMIVRGLNILSKEKGGNYLKDEELLNELVHINEYPTPFIGEFDNSYLTLPKEVIITPMKDHQRYFPVEDDNKKLLPYFISVRNGNLKGIENVIEGNKKVLLARLEDAKFFYLKDSSKTLEEYIPGLEKLGYHEDLGNMLDKTNRLIKLLDSIGSCIECGEESLTLAKRAAYLSKADLITSTVIEFTELQGVMGRIFALNNGEKPLVAQAIEEQYMPVRSGGELPSTTVGIMLSLAEKIDTITGLYSVGVEVTGSQDLYGQRRAVLGILNTLIDKKISLDILKVIRDSLYNYVESFGETFDYEEVVTKVVDFIKVRLRNMMIDKGFRYDIVDSVIENDNLNIYNIYEKIKALTELSKTSNDFSETVTKFVRVVNIASKTESNEIEKSVLTDEDVSILCSLDVLKNIDKTICLEQYKEALIELVELVEKIDEYLNNTLIMVDEELLRNSRLAIVKNVSDRILNIFNPTEIVR